MMKPPAKPRRDIGSTRRVTKTLPMGQWLLAMPAAAGLVIGAILVLLVIGAAATITPTQLQQRAAAELNRADFAAAAIDYRRLVQRFPESSEFHDDLRAAVEARSSFAER